MKKALVLVVLAVVLVTGALLAAVKESQETKQPPVIVANGFFTGSMISADGRSVLIVNTQTGDFEVFDIDRQGMERKTNKIYYSSIKYNHKAATRQIVKYDIIEDGGAGEEQQ